MTKILKTVDEVRAFTVAARATGKKVGFVPTMGNLHDGHISLMKLAQQHSDCVIASIFVNPTQFGANEDLDSYPRTFEADWQKLDENHVDAVFFPDETVIYPQGKNSTISIEMPTEMTQILCGVNRPTHFQGVATVVAKLLQIVRPDVAVFGKKDFQQLAIIRRLVAELFMDIEIVGGDIVREPNGLAMSSRNQYLSETQKQTATWLSKTLISVRDRINAGASINDSLAAGEQQLSEQGIDVEYLSCLDRHHLRENPTLASGILLVAARVGTTRLIDNLALQVGAD